MSVANELSTDIAAALLRGNNTGNVEARLRAALLAHAVLQNLSSGERPGRRGRRDEEPAVPRNSAAPAAS